MDENETTTEPHGPNCGVDREEMEQINYNGTFRVLGFCVHGVCVTSYYDSVL